MRYGWKKVRGCSFTRCDAPGPPPWFDETGEKKKRVAKGKGSDVGWEARLPGAPTDPDGGIDAEWEASDECMAVMQRVSTIGTLAILIR